MIAKRTWWWFVLVPGTLLGILLTFAWYLNLPRAPALVSGNGISYKGRVFRVEEIFSDAKERDLADAAARGDLPAVGRLLDAGANPNKAGQFAITPLTWALRFSKASSIRSLLEKGADINTNNSTGYDAMDLAVLAQDPQVLDDALHFGGNPNLQRDYLKRTPIYTAIDARNIPKMQRLIEAGANLNHRDSSGISPSMEAVAVGDYKVVFWLLQHGADVGGKNGADLARSIEVCVVPWFLPSYWWRWRVVWLLEERGVKVKLPK